MTDILLERTPDGLYRWALTDGDVVLTHTVSRQAEIGQRVLYAVSPWRGESPYDLEAGPDHDVWQSFDPPPFVAEYLLGFITATEGVAELPDVTFELTDARQLSMSIDFRPTDTDEVGTVGTVIG